MSGTQVVFAPPGPVGPLTGSEEARLKELERTIKGGLPKFLEVGRALAEISRCRLYRTRYPNFNAYCAAKLEIGASAGRHWIRAAAAADDAAPQGSLLPAPASLALAAPLVNLAGPARREVWSQAVSEAGGTQPRASRVAELVRMARDGLGGGSLARLVADEEREVRQRLLRQEQAEAGRQQAALEEKARASLGIAARKLAAAGFKAAAALCDQALLLCRPPHPGGAAP